MIIRMDKIVMFKFEKKLMNKVLVFYRTVRSKCNQQTMLNRND